jgi:hypothetical protein
MTKKKQSTRKRSKKSAGTLAGQQIDQAEDRSASVDERAKRKRRLIEGPEEFRSIRRDRGGS